MKPWERYSGAPTETTGPWSRYGTASPSPVEAQNPTEGMSGTDKFLAGAGKAFSDVWRGAKQIANREPSNEELQQGGWRMPDGTYRKFMPGEVEQRRQDLKKLNLEEQEARREDAPLMKTGAGLSGNIVGSVATTLPAFAVPGAGTLPGAAAIGGLTGLLQPTVEGESKIKNSATSAALSAGGQALVSKVLPAVAQWGREAVSNAATAAKQSEPVRQVIEAAQREGFVVPPSFRGGGKFSRAMESLAGKASVKQAASETNRKVAERAVRNSLGLADDVPINQATLDQMKREAWNVYDQVKNLGLVSSDQAYKAELKKIGQTVGRLGKNQQIDDLLGKLGDNKAFSEDIVADIMQLRSNASSRLSKLNYDPSSKALGRAERQAADALEGLLERSLSKTDKSRGLLQQFRDARTILAKVNNVEKSMSKGVFDVRKLAKTSSGKLDPSLRTTSKFSQMFPELNQGTLSTIMGGSPLDWTIGGAAAMYNQDPRYLALAAVRPVARRVVLSGLMQGAPKTQASSLARLASLIPDDKINTELVRRLATLPGAVPRPRVEEESK